MFRHFDHRFALSSLLEIPLKDQLALVIAAAFHDFGHPGFPNPVVVKILVIALVFVDETEWRDAFPEDLLLDDSKIAKKKMDSASPKIAAYLREKIEEIVEFSDSKSRSRLGNNVTAFMRNEPFHIIDLYILAVIVCYLLYTPYLLKDRT